RQLGGEKLLQVGLYLVRASAAILVERPPAGDRKRIGAAALEIEAGEMQPRQRLAERGAVGRRWPPDPHTVEEGDHRRRTAGELPKPLAPPVLDRLRTADPARVQVLHQGEKKRQVLGRHAPLVEGENEIATAGVDEEIRILDTFSDALIGEQFSDV